MHVLLVFIYMLSLVYLLNMSNISHYLPMEYGVKFLD